MNTKTIGAIVGVAACVGVLAGCSSDGTTALPSGAGEGGATAAGASAQSNGKPLSSYLLQQSDVPAGFTELQVPSGAGDLSGSVINATKNATITPASCQPDLSGLSTDDAENAPKALFTNASAGTSIISAVNPASNSNASVSSFRKYNLGDCSSYQLTSSVSGQSFTATVQTEDAGVEVPGVDNSVTVQQTTQTQIQGVGPRTSVVLIALIPVPGGTMTVQVGNVLGGSAPDKSLFAGVVDAAAKRVTG
ncbi:hypothetical protein [Williamsia herbipolensis]|uniref:hypothetical protein n=1 Tax=Williamsia herbipolensis TaxID=1603258 RepID=UPI0005F882DD|nr:hypothetical protein [Williamsia herbipolensis]